MSGRPEPCLSHDDQALHAPTIARVPDFFVVGHEKCGTSALDLMLKRHPEIFLPDTKEQKFFAPELRGGSDRGQDGSRPRTFEDYVRVFAPAAAEQRIGEVSPMYLRSQYAASRIAEVQPAARIIAILREPVSFLRSFHLQAVQNHIETESDFRTAMALEPLRREGKRLPRNRVAQTLFYSDHVHYVEQLRRYHAAFSPEQVLVLIYDDFRADNAAVVREILRFLDVDESFPIETVETNSLQGVRSMRLHKLRRIVRRRGLNPAAGGRLARAIDALPPRSLSSKAFSAMFRRLAYGPPAPQDERLTLDLRRRFKPEVVALSEQLDRNLVALWGYEDIS
jgi:hypothetical protein